MHIVASTFGSGDLVWLHNPQRKKGISPKLRRPWEGPYVAVEQLNDVVYRIQWGPWKKPEVVHRDRLWTILVNGLKRMHSQIRKWSLLLMSLCPSSLVGLVSLVSYTLSKAKISNPPCSRRFAPCSGPIRPGQWHYIQSPMAWWSATTGL